MAAGTTPQTAVFTSASFLSIAAHGYLAPKTGGTAAARQPLNQGDPARLTLTDGRRIYVCDTVRTSMRLLEKMRQSKQSFLICSDDVVCWATSWTKLLFAEATLSFQRLMTSYVGNYASGFALFTRRNLSSVQTLGEALQTVGFPMGGAVLSTSLDLDRSGVHAVVVDYRYTNNSPTTVAPGTLLDETGNGDPALLERAPSSWSGSCCHPALNNHHPRAAPAQNQRPWERQCQMGPCYQFVVLGRRRWRWRS